MAKKHKKLSYWERRAAKAEKKVNDGAKQVETVVVKAYKQAQSYLTRKAKKLFDRAKQQSGLDEQEARKALNERIPPDELVELKKLSQDIRDPKLQADAKKKLTALAYKERITRAEDLKAKSYLVSKQIADVQLDKQTDYYIEAIHDAYNETTSEAIVQQIEQAKSNAVIEVWDNQKYDLKLGNYEQAKKRGIPIEVWNDPKYRKTDHEFKNLSTRYTKNILESHWKGSNYSSRLWGDTEALAKRLEELFTVESLTGMSEHEMAQAIAKEFDRSIGVARRLIRTEANYMANQARLKAWKDRSVEHYRLVAVLDLRTSEICQSMDGKVFKVSEAVVNGKDGNYPPFHPWCRTIVVAVLSRHSLKGSRKANDPISNEVMTIQKRDTYDDWMSKLKEKYSDDEIELQKRMIRNRQKDNVSYRQLKDVLGKEHSPVSLDDYQEIKYNKGEEWDQLKRLYRDVKWMQEALGNRVEMEHGDKRPEIPPNSVADIYGKQGELRTRRFYGKTGKGKLDIDFEIGNPKHHEYVPHAHDWTAYEKTQGDLRITREKSYRKLTLAEKIANKDVINDGK